MRINVFFTNGETIVDGLGMSEQDEGDKEEEENKCERSSCCGC